MLEPAGIGDRDMSVEPTTTVRIDATPDGPTDPFGELRDDQVLRCEDPETGWQWFYERRGSAILKYHERTGYAAEMTALAAVAETIDCEGVVAYSVSRTYLEVYRGEL